MLKVIRVVPHQLNVPLTSRGLYIHVQWTTGKWDTSTKWDLSKTPLNLLEIHEIGSVDTSESKQQNYD